MAEQEQLNPAELLAEESSIRRENQRLKRDLKAVTEHVATLQSELDLLDGFNALRPDPPTWQVRNERRKVPRSTVVAMLSDLHLDEVVDPVQVPGNSYDRRIATERIATWADQLATLSDRDGGLIVLWGGDMVTGEIHAELGRTNEDSVLGTCLYWSEILAAAINLLAEHWPGVKVICTYGNHGRIDPKMQLKDYVRRNFDWLLAHLVARMTPGVEWHVPEQIDAEFLLFGRTHVLTHGNHGAKGGGGIGGLWPPIMRMVARLQQEYAARSVAVEHVWMGHWHTPTFGSNWSIAGTPKGADEFSRSLRLPPIHPTLIYERWDDRGAATKGLFRL